MAKRSDLPFTTINVSGAMLPPDLLAKIADLNKNAGKDKIPGLSPESYHLPEGSKLNEAIARSWAVVQAHWKSFQAKLEELESSDSGIGNDTSAVREKTTTHYSLLATPKSLTSITNERWLLPLFKELEYGRLTTSDAPVIDEKPYPIKRFYNHSPIHFVGCNLPLDKRTKGAAGAATASPHAMVQEFLNRSDDHLWAFLSNGLQLRILRDNVSLSRQAFVEFDLEAMMDGEIYADFALLWLLCHQSRVESDRQDDCWLEQWSKLAREAGTRVLEDLRVGVKNAIEALGRGFVGHPRNDQLRTKLQESGTLSKDDFYRQLLRIVYRLLFLFVAEDRSLLHPEDADESACELYDRHYSTRRLRDMSDKLRGSKHADLWHSLSLVFERLESEGCPQLGLIGLGSFLWRHDSTIDLLGPGRVANGKERTANGDDGTADENHSPFTTHSSPQDAVLITNDDLLTAIRALAFVEQDKTRRPVDYRNLGSEELGSVYESLLELHPEINAAAKQFVLNTAAGNERKTTGSYYTPDSLVQCLLDSALDPVVEARLAEAKRMARSEWRTVDGIYRERFISYANQRSSRSGSLETGDGNRKDGLRTDEVVSKRRAIWSDQSDATRISLDTVESGRGLGASGEQGVPAVHQDRSRQPQGTGDTTDPQSRGRDNEAGNSRTDSRRDNDSGPATNRPDPLSEEANRKRPIANDDVEQLYSKTPFAIRYSLFAEQALLDLKVCDPACGSGHFLIAAAHRLARHLARIRTGETEASPIDYQHALRDVIGRCIYGVDINPMAVELCKVSLWMEAIDPGRPLTFLDHRIQCGNSLLGTTPTLLAGGIPDDAFKPIEGDVKAFCTELKRDNKQQRKDRAAGQGTLFDPPYKLGNLPASFARLATSGDDTVTDVAEKERLYASLVSGADYLNARLLADTWCSVFVWKKDESDLGRLCPTENDFRKIENNPFSILPHVRSEVRRLADQYQFFHWHLAFPDVFVLPGDDEKAENEQTGWSRGFDVVLGNPPWEHTELREKEWFAEVVPMIAKAKTAAIRKRKIAELEETAPSIFKQFCDEKRLSEGLSHIVRNSGKHPLCGKGRINTYAIFAELKSMIRSLSGRAGMIVPSGIATDETTKEFFGTLVAESCIASLFDFDNRENIFPRVGHGKFKFTLLTIGHSNTTQFGFHLLNIGHLQQANRVFELQRSDIQLLNPNTLTCPVFRNRMDAEISTHIYRRVEIIARDGTEPSWPITFRQGHFNMTSASHLFKGAEELVEKDFTLHGNVFDGSAGSYLPLYEAKMANMFDHRAGTFEGRAAHQEGSTLETPSYDCSSNPFFVSIPRFWIDDKEVPDFRWVACYRLVSFATNDRTFITHALPRVGIGNSVVCMTAEDRPLELFLANAGCFVFDYCVRQKMGGLNLNFFIVKQLPAVSMLEYGRPCLWDAETDFGAFSRQRVLELTYTAWDLEAFALDCGYDGPPFCWNEKRRFQLRCELDAAYFHLYLGSPSEWGREANSEKGMANGDEGKANGEERMANGGRDEAIDDRSPLAIPYSPTANSSDELPPITNPELLEMFPTPRDAVSYIMETFPIVKRKDIKRTEVRNADGEVIQEGSYITKDTILKIYDEMAEVMEANRELRIANREKTDEEIRSQFASYLSPLSPPPGPPTRTDSDEFLPFAQWNEFVDSSHIHDPRVPHTTDAAPIRKRSGYPLPATREQFPETPLEALTCGVLVDLLIRVPGADIQDYREMLGLVLKPDTIRKLTDPSERDVLAACTDSLPDSMDTVDGNEPSWSEVFWTMKGNGSLDSVELGEAISLQPGETAAEVRDSYGCLSEDYMAFATAAITRYQNVANETLSKKDRDDVEAAKERWITATES